jgi:hypothetical protein
MLASSLANYTSSHSMTQLYEPKRKWKSHLSGINYRVFLVPFILLLVGGAIWLITLIFWPTNYFLLLFGEVIFAIGLFVAIILGFWIMTIVRLPQR